MPTGQPMLVVPDADAIKTWCDSVLEKGLSSLLSNSAISEWKQVQNDARLTSMDSTPWTGAAYGQGCSVFGKNIRGIGGLIDGKVHYV